MRNHKTELSSLYSKRISTWASIEDNIDVIADLATDLSAWFGYQLTKQ